MSVAPSCTTTTLGDPVKLMFDVTVYVLGFTTIHLAALINPPPLLPDAAEPTVVGKLPFCVAPLLLMVASLPKLMFCGVLMVAPEFKVRFPVTVMDVPLGTFRV